MIPVSSIIFFCLDSVKLYSPGRTEEGFLQIGSGMSVLDWPEMISIGSHTLCLKSVEEGHDGEEWALYEVVLGGGNVTTD